MGRSGEASRSCKKGLSCVVPFALGLRDSERVKKPIVLFVVVVVLPRHIWRDVLAGSPQLRAFPSKTS